MQTIDWVIVITLLAAVTGMAAYVKRYTNSVVDFLAAGRCAGRYMLTISEGVAGLGAISVVGYFEQYYEAGFSPLWWNWMTTAVMIVLAMSGWVLYRYRETRVLTLAQFFETRYSKSFRIYSGIICYVSGVINFAIFPAVGARFFVHFCGFPTEVDLGIFSISSFALTMLVLLGISLFFTFAGGQIAVMVTDFLQGIFTFIIFAVIIFIMLGRFRWEQITDVLQMRGPNESLINPFDTSAIPDFNPCFFFIAVVGMIYAYRSWQGSQGYNCAAKNPHEARMGNILSTWRIQLVLLMVAILPVCVYTFLHHPDFADKAAVVETELAQIDSEQIQKQMRVPLGLAHILPPGVMGLFCAVMLAAFISTHDTYLHSWGSMLIQDIILPFRRTPFGKKQHFWLLRLSILAVAVFIFFFSLFFKQTEYIFLYFSITGAVYVGGAGACIVGGLYWKRGTAAGAWTAMVIGPVVALSWLILQVWWPGIYEGMERFTPWLIDAMRYVFEGISARTKWINWVVGPEKPPLNGQWVLFFTMITCAATYFIVSLFTCRKPFNMDRMLHRGKYAIAGEHKEVSEQPWWERKLGITKEFTLPDKILYFVTMSWTAGWTIVFLFGSFWAVKFGIDDDTWLNIWHWYIRIGMVVGVLFTSSFALGGFRDMKYMFHTLKTTQRDEGDVGMVEHQD